MKKKLFLIFITLITIIIINPLKVNAEEGPIMAIDCGAIPDSYTGKFPGERLLFYRITKNDDNFWYMYNGEEVYSIKKEDNNYKKGIQWKDDEGKYYSSEKIEEMLNSGKCPVNIKPYDTLEMNCDHGNNCRTVSPVDSEVLLLVGTTNATEIFRLNENEYYFIKLIITGYESVNIVYSYYYSKDGTLKATNLGNTASDDSSPFFELLDYQVYLIALGNKKIYELTLDNGYKNYLEYFHSDITENDTIEYIFGNRINRKAFEDQVEQWYESNKLSVDGINVVTNNVKSEKKELINACTSLNTKSQQNEEYKFGTYSKEKMISDLNSVYNDYSNINSSFTFCSDGTPATLENAATNCVLTGLLGNYLYAAEDYEKKLGGDLYEYIQKDILETLNNKYSVNNSQSSMKETLETLTACTINLDKNYDSFGIDKNEISNLRKKYVELAEGYNINVVVDCESLLGQELIDKINSYLKIIKIAIPLILIAFGIVDFAKAVFSSSDDAMKKAQKDFIKRLGIAILIFFVPTIINLLLSIANKVWINIYPNSCGLF